MSNLTDLTALAVANGFAVDTSKPDYFGDVRATAINEDGTVKMLFDRHGKLISTHLFDNRKRTFRTIRIGVTKEWLGAA